MSVGGPCAVSGLAGQHWTIREFGLQICLRSSSAHVLELGPTSCEVPERPTTLARAENPGHARRGRSSSSSGEWHGRGIHPGLGHLPHVRKEGALRDGLSVTSASGTIHHVPGSNWIDIFHTARDEPHVRPLQKCRALGRKLLVE